MSVQLNDPPPICTVRINEVGGAASSPNVVLFTERYFWCILFKSRLRFCCVVAPWEKERYETPIHVEIRTPLLALSCDWLESPSCVP